MRPVHVDAIVDLTYGVLILIAIVLIVVLDTQVGLAFGLGVFASYVVHVVWKMARFDPEWMTRTVQETVEDTVGETVEDTVGQTVEEKMDETVEKTVGETVEKTVGETVERTVEDTVGQTVEEKMDETVEKTVGETVERTVGDQVSEVQRQIEAIEERIDRRLREDEIEELLERSAEPAEDSDT